MIIRNDLIQTITSKIPKKVAGVVLSIIGVLILFLTIYLAFINKEVDKSGIRRVKYLERANLTLVQMNNSKSFILLGDKSLEVTTSCAGGKIIYAFVKKRNGITKPIYLKCKVDGETIWRIESD